MDGSSLVSTRFVIDGLWNTQDLNAVVVRMSSSTRFERKGPVNQWSERCG